MNTLSENLINQIMLYVSYPCDDSMRTSLCDTFDGVLMFKTQRHIFRILSVIQWGFSEVRNHTSNDAEYSHEYNVTQKHIYYKHQVWVITKTAILRLCREYVQFDQNNNR